jgi:hypothetical protein
VTHGFDAWPVSSHSFTAPIGETIHYAMFSSGLAPKFGMGSVLGVILGGALGSFIQDGFRWEACEDPRELRRQMGGAVAMGLGAVLAAGLQRRTGAHGAVAAVDHSPHRRGQHLDRRMDRPAPPDRRVGSGLRRHPTRGR